MESSEPAVTACPKCKYKMRHTGGERPKECPRCGLPQLSPVAIEAMKRVSGLYRAGALTDAEFASAKRTIIDRSTE